jgi:hypothetical protein
VITTINEIIVYYQNLNLGATLCTIKFTSEIDIILPNPTSNLQKRVDFSGRNPQSSPARTRHDHMQHGRFRQGVGKIKQRRI